MREYYVVRCGTGAHSAKAQGSDREAAAVAGEGVGEADKNAHTHQGRELAGAIGMYAFVLLLRGQQMYSIAIQTQYMYCTFVRVLLVCMRGFGPARQMYSTYTVFVW